MEILISANSGTPRNAALSKTYLGVGIMVDTNFTTHSEVIHMYQLSLTSLKNNFELVVHSLVQVSCWVLLFETTYKNGGKCTKACYKTPP